MSNGTVEVHLCTIRRVNMQKKLICCKNRNITHCQTAKISLRLRYRAVPIHDIAIREKHLLGSELAFVNFYLILDLKSQVVSLQTAHSWANAGVLLGDACIGSRVAFEAIKLL